MSLVVIMIIIGLFIGEPVDHDAYFAEFHICIDDSKYEPVTEILRGTEVIFVCGIVEGDGSGQGTGALYLWYKGEGTLIRVIGHYPGTFFEKVNVKNLTAGTYKIDVLAARRVIAETEFDIIDISSHNP